MESALLMMSHLSVSDHQQLESRFEGIRDPAQGPVFAIPKKLAPVLSEKLKPYPLPARILIAQRYIDYWAQARELELEAEEWEVAATWHLWDMVNRNTPVLTGVPEYDAAIQDEASRVNFLEMELDEDLIRLRKNTATLRAMRTMCLDRMSVLETGEASEIQDVMQRDDQAAEEVRRCNVDDVFVQEDISEVWEHVEDNDHKMLRLRLIWVMEKERRDSELEKVRQRQMSDLLDGIEAMNVSEPEAVKDAREKAVKVTKAELSKVMADLTNLNIQRKEAFTQVLPRIFFRIGGGKISGFQEAGP